MSDECENPYPEGTSRYRLRRIRNLLGFDAPEVIDGEAQLHNHELGEVLAIVEEAVGGEERGDEDGMQAV